MNMINKLYGAKKKKEFIEGYSNQNIVYLADISLYVTFLFF